MANIFTYLLSKRKDTYRQLAKKHRCSPIKVYMIAHGRIAKTQVDFEIIRTLIDTNIVMGYRHV